MRKILLIVVMLFLLMFTMLNGGLNIILDTDHNPNLHTLAEGGYYFSPLITTNIHLCSSLLLL